MNIMKLKKLTPSLLSASLLAGFSMIAQPAHAASSSAENLSGSRPNIVFIFTDDHATQAIRAYNKRFPGDVTPNINEMAKKGVMFENCICANPLCGPSRATVITGKFSNKNHFYSNEADVPFDGSQATLPKLLRPAGYQSAFFGKWHLISKPTGFDYYEELTGQGIYYNPFFITAKGKEQIHGYVTDIITQHALDWLKNKRDPKKPFLLMIHHKAPHRDWLPGPQELKLWKNRVWAQPETLFTDYSGHGQPIKDIRMRISNNMYFAYDLLVDVSPKEFLYKQVHTWFNMMSPEQRAGFTAAYGAQNAAFLKNPPKGNALLEWKYQRYITDYLRCVKGVDRSIGEVLAYLKSSGLAKNTIVIYSSDQGVFLGDLGWFDKRMPYNESARMPLIMDWPGHIKANLRPTGLVQNVDFLPTFLDLAGAPIPKSVQGHSLVPMLEGANALANRDGAYIHFYEDTQEHDVPAYVAVRTERFIYANFYVRHYVELIDLKKDPLELKNVANDPAYAKDIVRLKKQLADLAVKYDDKTAPWGNQKIPKLLTENPLTLPPNAKPALSVESDDVSD